MILSFLAVLLIANILTNVLILIEQQFTKSLHFETSKDFLLDCLIPFRQMIIWMKGMSEFFIEQAKLSKQL